MHQWVVLKNNMKIYIKIYIKTAPTCFGAVTPSSGSALICAYWCITNKDLIYAATPPLY